jgi:hypothetical protein
VYLIGVYLMSIHLMGVSYGRISYTPARCTLVCEVHACICKMHVYEVYAAVGGHLGDTRLGDARLQGPACL